MNEKLILQSVRFHERRDTIIQVNKPESGAVKGQSITIQRNKQGKEKENQPELEITKDGAGRDAHNSTSDVVSSCVDVRHNLVWRVASG